MKKFLLLLVAVFFVGSFAMAQDGKKAFKQANRLLGTYNLDPGSNADKLVEAKDLIDEALEDAEIAAMFKAWILKGKIYNELIGTELTLKIIDPAHEIVDIENGEIALDALMKANELAVKSFEKRDVIQNLRVSAGHLSNCAITSFSDKAYEAAFKNFVLGLDLNDFFIEVGEEPSFSDTASLGEQVFYTAVSGYYAQDYEGVAPIFERALAGDSPDPFIYEGYYNVLKESNMEKALEILNEGRAKYPNETALLYAEINHMVAEGQLEALIIKLKDAVEKDPENISVYTTLGAVYDNLSTKAKADGETEKAGDYFNNSMSWFEQALAKDENNFDALYSLGALFYNKAATYTEALNELANDFSVAGNKKYDALKLEMDALFEKAFPYFQKAEAINDKDMNTLLAIKEIYARKGELEKSNEYKERIEALNN